MANLSSDEYERLMEQLTNVKMEKYELLEKMKKQQRESATVQAQVTSLEEQLRGSAKERERLEAQLIKSQGWTRISVSKWV